MTKEDEFLLPERHDQDLDVEGLADEMLVDAMLKGRYQDMPESTAQRATRVFQALEAEPRVISWHWKAGLSTAAAAIVVIGLMLVLSAPQEVQADLAPILEAFDTGDKTYQIDIGIDTDQPDFPRRFERRRFGPQPPFRSPRNFIKSRLLDGASLYTRGRNYVLTCTGPQGNTITKGYDGHESWLATPWGSSIRGQEQSLLREHLPDHISSLLFLNLRDILHKIQEQYILSAPSPGTPKEAQLQLGYYIAKRITPQSRIPECIELWVDARTNQLNQILFTGVRFQNQHMPSYILEIRLLNTEPLPKNWFTREAHTQSGPAL